MILRQFLHRDPVAISYLLGCVGHGLGAVVDPLFPIEPYLRAAEAEQTPIRVVIDTHLHADHLSAGRALAEVAGADYVLHESAGTTFTFRPVRDGETLDLGNVALSIMHTPGHTPEHLSLLVTDHTRAPEPWLLLSGHTLMVGDVGRTELASDAAFGARTLFASLARLKALPDHVEVLPGAFAGGSYWVPGWWGRDRGIGLKASGARARAGVADLLARGAFVMAASDLINLSGLIDDAKCFALVR